MEVLPLPAGSFSTTEPTSGFTTPGRRPKPELQMLPDPAGQVPEQGEKVPALVKTAGGNSSQMEAIGDARRPTPPILQGQDLAETP